MVYGKGLFKLLFSFCNAANSSSIRMFLLFLKKVATLIVRKISSKNIPFSKSDSEGSKKRKGTFLTYELCFKNASESLLAWIFVKFCYSVWWDCFIVYTFLWYFLINVNKKLSSWHRTSLPLYNWWQILSVVVDFLTSGTTCKIFLMI